MPRGVKLSDAALRRPVTVLVVTAALLVLGGVSLTRLKLDFLPKIDFPFVGVWVPYPNAIPEQVEKEIARPIEEMMATLGAIHEIRSWSGDDGAFVGVEFGFDRSVDVLRMEVKDRMEKVRPQLPSDVRDYQIFTFNSNDIPILVGRISAKGRDLSGSYDLLERRVLNPLRRVEGVGRVVVDGIAPKEYVIYLELDKIIEHSVDVERLFRLLNANNIDLSLGSVQNGRQRVSVRALGQFRDREDLENLQVTDAGVRLADVADIVYAEPLPEYYRRINGEPAIAFEIQKASGANIVEVSRRVNRVLADIKKDPALHGVDVVLFFDQADQIKNSLTGLLQSGLIGSLLAVSILLFFLRKLRATLVVAMAIPLSVIATCVFLFLTHRSLNVLTMMGLMLAVGMLVDNAIVVLESIHRRQQKGEDSYDAARFGAREVATAVTASTLTSVMVFAPVILSKGNELVVWLSEVGVTISVTLIFSLLACLTLVPLLASRMPRQTVNGEFGIIKRTRERYVRLLGWTAIRHPRRTGLLLVPAGVLLTFVAMKVAGFRPSEESEQGFKQDSLYMELEFTDNANATRVADYVDRIEPFLLARRDSLGIESLYTFYQSNYAAMSLFFQDEDAWGDKEIRHLRKWLRDHLPTLAGVEYRFGNEEDVGRGAKKLSVTLFGEDSDLLNEYAQEVQRRLSLLPDLEDVRTDVQRGNEEIRVVLNRKLAGRYGIQSSSVAQILGLTFRGVPLRKVQGDRREIDLGIILEPADRRNLENLREMPITYRDDKPIRLGQVADFHFARGPEQIRREQQRTALTVQGSYEGGNFNDLVEQVTAMMNSLDLPPGYAWSYGREMRRSEQQQDQMGANVLLALFCVYLVMAVLFESFLHPLVIMLCVPFAFFGVVWTLILTGTDLGLFAMIGIVILIGIVVNNGIVLIDHINFLRRSGYSREEAILEGCRDRFRPILMTAATTILGLAPLAVGGAYVAGAYYFPLARAVMGGLAASTFLTLIILPTFYVLAEGGVAWVRSMIAWGLGRGRIPWRRGKAETQPTG